MVQDERGQGIKSINQLNEIRITLLWRQSCVEGVLFDKETNQMLYFR